MKTKFFYMSPMDHLVLKGNCPFPDRKFFLNSVGTPVSYISSCQVFFPVWGTQLLTVETTTTCEYLLQCVVSEYIHTIRVCGQVIILLRSVCLFVCSGYIFEPLKLGTSISVYWYIFTIYLCQIKVIGSRSNDLNVTFYLTFTLPNLVHQRYSKGQGEGGHLCSKDIFDIKAFLWDYFVMLSYSCPCLFL